MNSKELIRCPKYYKKSKEVKKSRSKTKKGVSQKCQRKFKIVEGR